MFCEKLQDAEMFKQYFCAENNEDNTAGKLGLALIFRAEDISDFSACCGERKGSDSDESGSLENVDLEEGKRNTDGESVDTCGNCHRKHGLKSKGNRVYIAGTVFTAGLGESFTNHFAAD